MQNKLYNKLKVGLSMIYGTENKIFRPTADTHLLVTEPSELLPFLLGKLKKQSRNNIKSLLTHKQVLVDGQAVSQHNYPLKVGQTVQLLLSVDRGQKQKTMPEVLFEDEAFLVINKPAGLLSIATDREKKQTAYHLLTDYVRKQDSRGRIFVVHRLDRDTSGVLLFAKTEQMKLALQDNWDSLVSKREYTAIAEGTFQEKQGRIQSWLKETKTHLSYSSPKPGNGQKAITNYTVLKERKDCSLLQIHLETGRKNQIRVHMKELGHPIVGDRKYGANTNPLKRLGLHANRLEFTHPFTKETLCFETDLPTSFQVFFHL